MLPHEHLGYILPLRLLHILTVEFYRKWRDQRSPVKFVYYLWPKLSQQLVGKPTSQDRVLTYIRQWPSYAHLEYFESWSKLKTFTAQKLKHKGASWHRHHHRVIYCNRSQIFERKRDCSWSIRECIGEQENGRRENWLDPIKQDRRFQTWRQRKYRRV